MLNLSERDHTWLGYCERKEYVYRVKNKKVQDIFGDYKPDFTAVTVTSGPSSIVRPFYGCQGFISMLYAVGGEGSAPQCII